MSRGVRERIGFTFTLAADAAFMVGTFLNGIAVRAYNL